MNPQDLLQALKLTLGSTNDEIRMAEQALEKVYRHHVNSTKIGKNN